MNLTLALNSAAKGSW